MQKLDPKAVWIFFIRFLFSGLLFVLFTSFWLVGFLSSLDVSLNFLWGIIIVLVVFVILCWVWAKLTYRFWMYELTEDAFKKEQGVIWKKYVSIPYERIQNVDIRRGLIARILRLSDLYIQTAGASAVMHRRGISGAGAEGYLPGLNLETAEKLRDDLIKKAKGLKQGL